MNSVTVDLNDDNFILFAMQNYVNPHCLSMNEFRDDLKRIKYIKRLFNRYETKGVIKERLVLNHIIMFYNVFETQAATKMLFSKIAKKHHSKLKTFLLYLNFMPDMICGINGKNIISSDILLDMNLVKLLRQYE